MRTFIAISLPQDLKEEIYRIENFLQKFEVNAKWVNLENLHLTLKFLGEIKQENLLEIKNPLINVGKNFSSIDLTLENFGFFPNEYKPKIFYLALKNNQALKFLAQTLEESLIKLGFSKKSYFQSHITLARFKDNKGLKELFGAIKSISFSKELKVKEFVVFKSVLTNSVPIYEEIFRVPLTKN